MCMTWVGDDTRARVQAHADGFGAAGRRVNESWAVVLRFLCGRAANKRAHAGP